MADELFFNASFYRQIFAEKQIFRRRENGEKEKFRFADFWTGFTPSVAAE